MGKTIASSDLISSKIHFFKGEKILFDFDLAVMYGVAPKALKQSIRRNLRRFPADFMLELTMVEWASLRSQFVTLENGRGKYSKYPPMAFTGQGVAMLSSVLKSNRAIEVNVAIMRTFVALRKWMQSNKKLAEKIRQLENEYDEQFKVVFDAIRQLIRQEAKKMRPIGFRVESKTSQK